MIAKIKIWGNEYTLSSISWQKNGLISHVTFEDENESFYVIHRKVFESELDAETNRLPEETINANLEEIVFWTKK